MWDPGIEHQLTGLEANTFSHQTISKAPVCFVPLFTWNDDCLSRTPEEMGLPEEVPAQHWGHLRDKTHSVRCLRASPSSLLYNK